MKKRGFGKGWWNGTGGKFNTQKDSLIIDTAKRETEEEVGVTPLYLNKVALLHFLFPDNPKKRDWNQDVHVFITKKWQGTPKETEEMKPKWFKFSKIPYKKMWDDDPLWLPRVLLGEKIEARFSFDGDNKMLDYKVENL